MYTINSQIRSQYLITAGLGSTVNGLDRDLPRCMEMFCCGVGLSLAGRVLRRGGGGGAVAGCT